MVLVAASPSQQTGPGRILSTIRLCRLPPRPEMLFQSYPYALQGTPYYPSGFTYPSSPASVSTGTTASNGTGEFRRSLHRTAVEAGTASGSGTLRSQSQPRVEDAHAHVCAELCLPNADTTHVGHDSISVEADQRSPHPQLHP